MTVLVGLDLAALRARAEAAIDAHFAVTATGRYAVKVAAARLVEAGGSSSLISAEAVARGMTPSALAGAILHRNETVYEATELARVQAKLAVRAASTPALIIAALKSAGIKLGG